MAEILELKSKSNDEMVPVEEWDGACWQAFFDEFCVPAGEMHGVSPWEYLANFVKTLTCGGGSNG